MTYTRIGPLVGRLLHEAMPPFTDIEGIQRLDVNYFAKFLPELSETMGPIRQLVRNGVPWNWATAQQRASEEVKKLVTNAPIPSYYDSKKPLMIQCGAPRKASEQHCCKKDSP